MSRTKDDKLSNPRHVPNERPGPLGGKRDRNRRRRTQALLDASLTLFLERGIEVVTIDEIARAAEMAKGSFYRYFKSKEDLVDALLEPLLTTSEAAFDTCKADLQKARTHAQLVAAYTTIGAALAQTGLTHTRTLYLYLQESRGADLGARKPICALSRIISDGAIDLTIVAQEHNLLRKIDPRVSALAVVGSVERLLQSFLADEFEGLDPTAIISDLITLVLDGLRVTSD